MGGAIRLSKSATMLFIGLPGRDDINLWLKPGLIRGCLQVTARSRVEAREQGQCQ